ncbi:MAG TPA: sterol desaturase family protein [Candidatus Koribacter sp.]
MHTVILYFEIFWVMFCVRLKAAGICIFVGLIAEALAKREPRSTSDSRFFNYGCTAIYFAAEITLGLIIAIEAGRIVGLAHSRLHILQSRPGIAFSLLLALLTSILGDLGYYWLHRWEHKSKWLRAIHEIHHSDESVNVTSALRIHWLEVIFTPLLALIPSIFLPNPITVLPASYLISNANAFFNHLNLPIRWGWFDRILISPSSHRLHHSTFPQHIDKNFAGVWMFWDVLFGTYVHPVKGEHPPTGLSYSTEKPTVASGVVKPFRVWRTLLHSDEVG